MIGDYRLSSSSSPFASFRSARAPVYDALVGRAAARHSSSRAVIQPGKRVSGYVFTPLDEAVKQIDVRLLGRSRSLDFPFTVEVPGLVLPHRASASADGLQD